MGMNWMMKLAMGALESVPGSCVHSSWSVLEPTWDATKLDGACGAPCTTSWKFFWSFPYGFEAVQMYREESATWTLSTNNFDVLVTPSTLLVLPNGVEALLPLVLSSIICLEDMLYELLKTWRSLDQISLIGSSPNTSQVRTAFPPSLDLITSKLFPNEGADRTLTFVEVVNTDPIPLELSHKYSPSSDFSASIIANEPFSRTWRWGPLTIPVNSFIPVSLASSSSWFLVLLPPPSLEGDVKILDRFHWWVGLGTPSDWQSITNFFPLRTEYSWFGFKTHFGLAAYIDAVHWEGEIESGKKGQERDREWKCTWEMDNTHWRCTQKRWWIRERSMWQKRVRKWVKESRERERKCLQSKNSYKTSLLTLDDHLGRKLWTSFGTIGQTRVVSRVDSLNIANSDRWCEFTQC